MERQTDFFLHEISQRERKTIVELSSVSGRREFRLHFGEPEEIQHHVRGFSTRSDARLIFRSDQIFCLHLWEKDEHGTNYDKLFICRALRPKEIGESIPCVRPAAQILLECTGKEQVRSGLAAITEIAAGARPEMLSPNTWLALDFNLKAAKTRFNQQRKGNR